MYVIQASQLIDGNGSDPHRDVSVFVGMGRFKAIEPSEPVNPGPEIEVIAAPGPTLMPGMIDCRTHIHVHSGPAISDALHDGLDSVEHGVGLTEEQSGTISAQNCFYVPKLSAHTCEQIMGKEGTGLSDRGCAWLVKVFEDRWVSLERAHRAGVKPYVGHASRRPQPGRKPGYPQRDRHRRMWQPGRPAAGRRQPAGGYPHLAGFNANRPAFRAGEKVKA